VRDQVLHPDSTAGKTTVLYILIFRFFIWDGKTKDFWQNNSKHSPNSISSWFRHECHSDLLVSSPSIWILPHFHTIHWLSLYSGSVLSSDDFKTLIITSREVCKVWSSSLCSFLQTRDPSSEFLRIQ
jgi:hypothetical protein